MTFDFDEVPNRTGGDSVKWNRYAGRDVLPLWVADMDFPVPPAIREALHRRVEHGVFGYAEPWPSLVDAVQAHLAGEYDWGVDPTWIVWVPGLVSGLNVACRAVGGGVFTSTPVYPPFLTASARVVTAPLALRSDRWEWDLEAVEAALAPETRLLLLCHPHNPVGRSWSEAELREIDALAERHRLKVCSDEIHCGLVLEPGLRHRPYATLSPEAARRSITLLSPSKTFNLPGLGCALAVVPDSKLRRRFREAMHGIVPAHADRAAARGPVRQTRRDALTASPRRSPASTEAVKSSAFAQTSPSQVTRGPDHREVTRASRFGRPKRSAGVLTP